MNVSKVLLLLALLALYTIASTARAQWVGGDGTDPIYELDSKVGVGTHNPQADLHFRLDRSPVIKLEYLKDGVSGNGRLQQFGSTRLGLNQYSDGPSLIDLNPRPALDGVSEVRLFRETNTSGEVKLKVYKGDGSGAVSAQIGANGLDSYFQFHGGRFGIGTDNPQDTLHILSESSSGIRLQAKAKAGDPPINGRGELRLYGATRMALDQHSDKTSLIDLNPLPGANLEAAVRLFRSTNTTGKVQLSLHRGDGSGQLSAVIGSNGLNSYFQAHGGNIGIGTTNPEYRLDVRGSIRADEVIIEPVGGADFVFEEDYELMPLQQVEEFISQNGHLPGIQSAEEMEAGVGLSDLQMKLLQKLEELTLYAIELKDENRKLEERLSRLEKGVGAQDLR